MLELGLLEHMPNEMWRDLLIKVKQSSVKKAAEIIKDVFAFLQKCFPASIIISIIFLIWGQGSRVGRGSDSVSNQALPGREKRWNLGKVSLETTCGRTSCLK